MAAGHVDLVIDQGEDFTCQLVYSDFTDNPIPVTLPMRMDVKSQYGQVMFSLYPPDELPPDSIPAMTYNTSSGLIQLHISKEQSALLVGGTYNYDLFVNVDDGETYTGNQQVRLIYGTLTSRPRTTQGI